MVTAAAESLPASDLGGCVLLCVLGFWEVSKAAQPSGNFTGLRKGDTCLGTTRLVRVLGRAGDDTSARGQDGKGQGIFRSQETLE